MDTEDTALAGHAEEQPTTAGDTADESKTQSIHAWSLTDDADTEIELPQQHSWRTPALVAAAAAIALAAGVGVGVWKWSSHHDASAPTHSVAAPAPAAPAPAAPAASAPVVPPPPAVVIQPNWPNAWKNAARAFEQVPPPPGQCYAEDGAPFTWENYIGAAVNCTPPAGAQTGGFLPLPPRMRGVLPQDPDVRRQFGDVPTQTPVEPVYPTAQEAPSCTERSCPGGNF